MAGTDSASGVPRRWDIVIDGWGYVLDRTWDPNSLRHPPTSYKFSPTFVERQNVGGDYGDTQQDFWLTESQRDWSGGESRLHFDSEVNGGSNMFFSSSGIDPTVEGQITLAGQIATATAANSYRAGVSGFSHFYTMSDSHLYSQSGDLGAHGLGTSAMTIYGMTQDSNAVYMASTSAGTVGVRKYTVATTTFATFSATASDSIAYLNNTLYGAVNSTAVLQSYSTAGAVTTIFTWKDSAGNARAQSFLRLLAFGGSLLILIQPTLSSASVGGQAEVWQYNGTSTFMIAKLPPNFEAYEMTEVDGVVFISGQYHTSDYTVANGYVPAIFSYLNGNLDELWRPPGAIDVVGSGGIGSSFPPAMAGWHNTLLFTGNFGAQLMRYDLSSGAVYSLGGITAGTTPFIVTAANQAQAFVYLAGSTGNSTYSPGRAATSGTVTSSQFDFNSSLPKYMRGIRIFWTGQSGTSVDIAYDLNNTGVFTTLQAGAVSGTEYPLGLSARTITVKLTLHGAGAPDYFAPVVTRLYVRAAPIQDSFRFDTAILDLSGATIASSMNEPAVNPVRLRDGTYSTLTGLQMAANLRTSVQATSPIVVTDRFGTFNAIIEPDSFVLEEISPGEFRAFVTIREV